MGHFRASSQKQETHLSKWQKSSKKTFLPTRYRGRTGTGGVEAVSERCNALASIISFPDVPSLLTIIAGLAINNGTQKSNVSRQLKQRLN